MKKYIFIISIFFVALSFIVFYLSKNIEINNSIKEYQNVQQISYELEILNQKQTMLTSKLNSEINYDEFVSIAKRLQNQLRYYSEIIEEINDKKLKKLLKNLSLKNQVLISVHEDIKTDYAVIKNSKMWLSQSYSTYLQHIEDNSIDIKFLQHIFNVINFTNSITEYKEVSLDIYQADKLNMHLKVIYKRQKSIENSENELKANNITQNIDNIILHTLKQLHKLNKKIEEMIRMLFASVVFLIFFGFIVYIKEVISSLNIYRLKNELQQFVDALNKSAIVSKTDLKGIITYVNDQFCEVSEYSRAELIGKSHNLVRHTDMDDSFFKDLWQTIQKKQVFKKTIKNSTKNGGYYFVDTSIMPILNIYGEIEEYLAVRYDVTELVDSRDKAIEAEKVKGEFLSNMSHELRTPLNAINGFSAILKRIVKDEKQIKYLQNIMDSSDNLVGLINDILDLSKLQSGKFSLDYQEFKLKERVTLLLSRLKPLFDEAEMTLHRNFDDSMESTLNGDWLRISQIITNLISNAIKFSPKGKEIELEIKYVNSQLIIKVRDDGIGMSLEAQEKIFKPFEQADNTTTKKYGGTGLGLSIVTSLVEQMKGEIYLESTEGQGSCFKISLPLRKVHTKEQILESFEEEQEREPLNAYVLIAEDNKTNQMLVGILMQEFGIRYKIANDGVEAVIMFGEEKFDLVLMDENMPNLNGSDAMKKIHSLYGKETPIIALTANAMVGDKDKFLEAGMSGYVSKPIDDDELYNVIKNTLKQ